MPSTTSRPKNPRKVIVSSGKVSLATRIEACIRDYTRRQKTYPYREVEWFASLSFDEAIKNAALATNWQGNRFSHQYRLKDSTLQKALTSLKSIAASFKGTSDFDQLFGRLQSSVGKIHGIGELYLYDTTLRIGANLGLLPQKVYLHAGTRGGALALGIKCKGRKFLGLAELPTPFRTIPAYQVEDILCIYKGYFSPKTPKDEMPGTCCLK